MLFPSLRRLSGQFAVDSLSSWTARSTILALSFCVCAANAGRAQAQEGTVSFDFEGSHVEVRVLTGGAPGDVEVVDGARGAVSVRDRRGSGSAYLRFEDGVMSVENRSGVRSYYVIAVPPDASVSLAIDRRTVLAVAAAGGRRIAWSWPGEERSPSRIAPEQPSYGRRAPPPGPRGRPRIGFSVNAFVGEFVADSVDVYDLHRIESLKIVLARDHMRVSGDRSVRFGYDEEIGWGVISPRADRVEVTLELPADIARFKLKVGDVVVWEARSGRGHAYCEPVAEIRDRRGRDLWVFTPIEGRFECPLERSRWTLRGPTRLSERAGDG